MGTHICGWVEVTNAWGVDAVVAIEPLVNRGYDAFGYLFGVRNYAGFTPLFANRGLPAPVSKRVAYEYGRVGNYAYGATYATAEEIAQQVCPETQAERLDERVHAYAVFADGHEEFIGKSNGDFLTTAEHRHVAAGGTIRHSGGSLYAMFHPDAVATHYRCKKLTAAEALTKDWETVFELIRFLGARYGANMVRLVVWFVG